MSCAAAPGTSYYGFNDLHAAVANAAAGRRTAANDHIAAVERAALGSGSHATVLAETGLPLVRAIYAFAGGDAAGAADLLLAARPRAHGLGGSNAQRDLLSLTLLAAAEQSGNSALAASLAAERLRAKPDSPFARALMARTTAAADPLEKVRAA
jgi:hypothetical protein